MRVGRIAVDRLVHGLPAGAPAEVRGEGAVEVHAAASCPELVRRATRTRIPGVQKPHCEPPVATKLAASRSRTAASRPSTVVTARPSTARRGRDARDARFAVDQHRAAAALALGRAPVLHREHAEALAQDREQRLAGRGVDLDLLVVAHELHPMPSSGHGQAG